MSTITVQHHSARPEEGVTHDTTQTRVHASAVAITIHDYGVRGWHTVSDVQIKLSPQDGGRLTDFHLLTFARAKYPIGTDLMWHRPTQEPESPIQVLPCKVMGQFADGPYQLFVFSFQGGHIQMAPPEQLTPVEDYAAVVLQGIVKRLVAQDEKFTAALEAYDVVSKYQIELEGRISALEAAATAPEKRNRKDPQP